MSERISWIGVAGVSATLLMTGCGSTRLDGARTDGPTAWPTPRPLHDQVETYRPPECLEQAGQSQPPEIPEPSGDLTLRRAVALTLLNSPELKAFALQVRAAEARSVEAGLWTNPELEFEMDEFGGTGERSGTDAAEFAVSLGQTFPLGGDIERRRDLAGYRAQLAGWDYEAARIGVLTELAQRYVSVLAEQQSLAVAEEELKLAEAVLATTRKRVEAGAARPIERIRARVPVAQAEVRVKRSRRSLEAVRRQLALMWNQPSPAFGAVAGDLDRIAEPPAPEALAMLINQNPQVARWAVEVSARRAEEAFAKADRMPDVTGRIGVKQFNELDETALVMSLSLPLPIFDRNQGDIQAARLDVAAAEQRQREAEARLERQISAAWTQLANAYDEAVVLRERALPAATEAFGVTRAAFEQGDVAFLDVLDAERTLVELHRQRVAALADYHTAVAEIEGLIGRSLDNIDTKDTP
jgi:cobalt-zinc-cadmium efflux system outer membrane protein